MQDQRKYVLITGATSGIGYALAQCFAADGYGLLFVSSNLKHLEEAAEQLKREYAAEVHFYVKDLAKKEAAEELYQKVKEDGFKIECLVNNAGFGLLGRTDQIDMKKEEQMLVLNMITPVKLTKLFGKDMAAQGGGKILNVASTGAFQPGPYNSTYYASKAFVYNYSRAVRYELKSEQVTVSTLCPGTTGTKFFERAGTKTPGFAMSPQRVAKIAYRGLMRGKDVIIPGTMNKLLRFVPVNIKLAAVAVMKERQAGGKKNG